MKSSAWGKGKRRKVLYNSHQARILQPSFPPTQTLALRVVTENTFPPKEVSPRRSLPPSSARNYIELRRKRARWREENFYVIFPAQQESRGDEWKGRNQKVHSIALLMLFSRRLVLPSARFSFFSTSPLKQCCSVWFKSSSQRITRQSFY